MSQPPYGAPGPYGEPGSDPHATQPYSGQPYSGQPPYGGHPPQGYPPPGPGYYVRPPGTNGLAIASLVLGILWIYWIGSILALVFGYVAKKQIRAAGQTGDGMATAGIVLGWVGVGFLGLFVVLGVTAGVFGGL